jgi:hypothetical protein
MSVSGISSGAAPSPSGFPPDLKQRRADLQALRDALEAGDLAGARAAYAGLRQDVPNAARHAGFDALGRALDAGDIGAAQKAFADLKRNVQAALFGLRHRNFVGTVVPAWRARTEVGGSAGMSGIGSTGSTLDVKS